MHGRVYILDHTLLRVLDDRNSNSSDGNFLDQGSGGDSHSDSNAAKIPIFSAEPTICEDANARVFTHMPVVPRGEVGEICIGGPQLALGYLNNPEETAAKFIHHPELGRLYRTGDLGALDLKSNAILFRGRIDHQVKIRGHRIELQSVESALNRVFSEAREAAADAATASAGGPGANGSDAGAANAKLLSAIDYGIVAKEDESLVAFLRSDTGGGDAESTRLDSIHSGSQPDPGSTPIHTANTDTSTPEAAKPKAGYAPKTLSRAINSALVNLIPVHAIPSEYFVCKSFPVLASSHKVDRKGLGLLRKEAGLRAAADSSTTSTNSISTMIPSSSLDTLSMPSSSSTSSDDDNLRATTIFNRPAVKAKSASALESFLLQLCREALRTPRLDYTDDFITDVDADSLRIARLAVVVSDALREESNKSSVESARNSKVWSSTTNVTVSVRDLLVEARSVAKLAAWLEKKRTVGKPSVALSDLNVSNADKNLTADVSSSPLKLHAGTYTDRPLHPYVFSLAQLLLIALILAMAVSPLLLLCVVPQAVFDMTVMYCVAVFQTLVHGTATVVSGWLGSRFVAAGFVGICCGWFCYLLLFWFVIFVIQFAAYMMLRWVVYESWCAIAGTGILTKICE